MSRLVLIVFFVLSGFVASACEFTLSIEKGEKSKYNVGDEIVVKVHLAFTHRVCNIDIQSTKYDAVGMEILGGTDWKEVSTGVYERKLKLKVTGTEDGNLKLNVFRECGKSGGSASLALLSKPVKKKVKR